MIALLIGTLASAGVFGADRPPAGADQAVPEPVRGPLDQEITLVGRDEAALPLPPPWRPPVVDFPPLDLLRPPSPLLPPWQPPAGDWADFLPHAGYTYVGCTGARPGHPIHGNGDTLCST